MGWADRRTEPARCEEKQVSGPFPETPIGRCDASRTWQVCVLQLDEAKADAISRTFLLLLRL
jgi:hypothetical protein